MEHIQLDLLDPGAVPVRLVLPLDKELPLDLGRLRLLLGGAGHRVRLLLLFVVLLPTPGQDFLNFACEHEHLTALDQSPYANKAAALVNLKAI